VPGDIERVRRIGLEKYIEQQLRPETIPDQDMTARLATLDTLTLNSRELAEDYFMPAQMAQRRAKQQAASQPTESATGKREARTPEQAQMMQAQRQVFTDLAQQKILRAVYSDRQLNEVLVDFWFNHFNVFAGKGLTRNYLTEYERDGIRPHVLGKFRDLLEATATSPAMLFYLDNWQSAAAEGATTAAPNTRTRVNPSNPRRPFGRPGQIGRPPRQRTVADLPQNALALGRIETAPGFVLETGARNGNGAIDLGGVAIGDRGKEFAGGGITHFDHRGRHRSPQFNV